MNEDFIYRLEPLLDRYPQINEGFDEDIRLGIRRLAQVDRVLKLLPAAIRQASDQLEEGASEESLARLEALQAVLDHFSGDERLLRLMAGEMESNTQSCAYGLSLSNLYWDKGKLRSPSTEE